MTLAIEFVDLPMKIWWFSVIDSFPRGDPPQRFRLVAWPRTATAAAGQAGSGPRGPSDAVVRGAETADGQHAEGDRRDIYQNLPFLPGEMVVMRIRMMMVMIVMFCEVWNETPTPAHDFEEQGLSESAELSYIYTKVNAWPCPTQEDLPSGFTPQRDGTFR